MKVSWMLCFAMSLSFVVQAFAYNITLVDNGRHGATLEVAGPDYEDPDFQRTFISLLYGDFERKLPDNIRMSDVLYIKPGIAVKFDLKGGLYLFNKNDFETLSALVNQFKIDLQNALFSNAGVSAADLAYNHFVFEVADPIKENLRGLEKSMSEFGNGLNVAIDKCIEDAKELW